MEGLQKTYFPNLDATRFFAFLPVFFTHVFYSQNPEFLASPVYHFIDEHLKVGILGLDYFFVLSSFLITWIILEEFQFSQSFNFKNYFIRRSLRIWPLYFIILFIGYGAAHLFTIQELPPIVYPMTFILNFYIIEHGDSFLFFLVILWSVSVEEQFYLGWAIFLKFLRKYLPPICFLLIGISLLFRYYHLDDQRSLYFHTASTLSNFSIGALVAYIAFHKKRFYYFLQELPRVQLFAFYFLLFLLLIFYKSIFNSPLLLVFERLIFSCFFGFIIFEQSFCKERLFNLGRWKVTNYIGSCSFGLYCFHGVVITIFIKLSAHFGWNYNLYQLLLFNPILLLFLTIGLSSMSYELFEKRILKLKEQFRGPYKAARIN